MISDAEGKENGDFLEINIDHGIMRIRFAKALTWDLEIAKETVKLRLEKSQNISFPVLLDARIVKSITKDARDYLATEEAVANVTAGALLIDSKVSKVMANFYMMINKPAMPFKVFTDEEQAMKWLRQFLE
ncbi:MAG: hypothetical protein WD077_12195 [Bacteroidia bacterium]